MESEETVIHGIAAAPGIAIGTVYIYDKHVPKASERSLGEEEIPAELERLHTAVLRSVKELEKIRTFAAQKIGDRRAKIFDAQIMILNDSVLYKKIEERIAAERKNADYIVADEIGKYQHLMLSADDEYMRERAFDVEDVKNRIVRNIHQHQLFSRLDHASVIVAQQLTAADTVLFSRNDVLGYATDFGGITSHAAILSRSLKIPAVVGLHKAYSSVTHGDPVIIDGFEGILIIKPNEERIREYQAKIERYRYLEHELDELHDLPAVTADFHYVSVEANVEFESNIEQSLQSGAEGIGLFRTESLVIDRNDFPDEEEQFIVYDSIAAAVAPRPVVMRTFDIGGDKVPVDSFSDEENPFLGWRGLRIGLDHPDLFLRQIRAMLRASSRKNVSILLPMVSTLREVRDAKALIESAKHELRSQSVPFDDSIKIGVMIEVPAAAIMAEQIAREVDFLSIGTNDLIQYVLAVDRGNDSVAKLYSEFDPSILFVLKRVIDAAHRVGKPVSMCGEMAGDPLATLLLIGLGLDAFSMVPAQIPAVKKIIRGVTYIEAKRLAATALQFTTVEEVEAFFREHVRTYISSLLLIGEEEQEQEGTGI